MGEVVLLALEMPKCVPCDLCSWGPRQWQHCLAPCAGQPKALYVAEVLSFQLVQVAAAGPVPAACFRPDSNGPRTGMRHWQGRHCVRRAEQPWAPEALWRCGGWPAQVRGAAGADSGTPWGIRAPGPQGSMRDQGSGPSGLPPLRAVPTAALPPCPWACCCKARKWLWRLWTVLCRSESPPEKTEMFTQNTAILTAIW